MFSLFSKSKPADTTATPPSPEATAAETAPAQPAAQEHSLASMHVEAPDVPPQGQSAGYGLDVGALLEPPPAPAGGAAQVGPKDEARTAELTPKIVEAISTVYDPEIPVNIYELGLIYTIEADAESKVKVEMTLTSPACPSAQQLPSEVRYKVKAIEGVKDAFVDVVWEPAWTKDLMSEDAKIALGMF
jgi:FeS assembly SUF system protein